MGSNAIEPTDTPFPTDVFLEVLDGARQGLMFPITQKTVTIGREPGCDLVLEDPYVSRKHCQIVFRGDHFTVLDLGSLNKTKVRSNEYLQRNLKHDYILTLGKTRLRFVWEKANEWVRERQQSGPMNGRAESEGTVYPEA
jgi:pSer/pThr/pTyr-binding forkhead associated (FHA) protein